MSNIGTRLKTLEVVFDGQAGLDQVNYERGVNGVAALVEHPEQPFFVVKFDDGRTTAINRRYVVAFTFSTEEFEIPATEAEEVPDGERKVVKLDEARKSKAKRKL